MCIAYNAILDVLSILFGRGGVWVEPKDSIPDPAKTVEDTMRERQHKSKYHQIHHQWQPCEESVPIA